MKSIKKEVMQREMAIAARRTRKQLEKDQKKGKVTHRLGKVKYEEPTLEVKLSNELPDSLRLLKVSELSQSMNAFYLPGSANVNCMTNDVP
jgi:hypothetical protein